MAKSNSNGNGAGNTSQPTIHLVLQGKGGVGKSLVASWLAEFLIKRGQAVHCIDGDPVNRSLGQFQAFAAERLDLLNRDGVLHRASYDALMDRFLHDDDVFVVDSGATAFLPFWTYLVESDAVRVLRAAGRRVYIHIPISAGEMLNDTLLGFKTLAASATERTLVVWINEYFGPVEREGKTFSQMQVYLENQDKVVASVGIRERARDTFGKSIQLMRENKLTFGEAIGSEGFGLMDRHRLGMVRAELFDQLEQTPFA
jgi:hypothetical protein